MTPVLICDGLNQADLDHPDPQARDDQCWGNTVAHFYPGNCRGGTRPGSRSPQE
jgi:hypothetical protein